MKRKLLILTLSLVLFNLYPQGNYKINVSDDVYIVLRNAELKGYCKPLSKNMPYTENYIIEKLNEIYTAISNTTNNDNYELRVINDLLNKFKHQEFFDYKNMSFGYISNQYNDFPINLEYSNGLSGLVSTGVYQNKDLNSFGYETWFDFNLYGDFSKYFSYFTTGFIDLTSMPLYMLGSNYEIGTWIYDIPNGKNRTIITYSNNSVLPYSYKKHWDGSIYGINDINASGLSDWPFFHSFGFGMIGDMRLQFFDKKIEIGLSRIDREWAAMDQGSSLVLNMNSRPFFGFDYRLDITKWFSMSGLTGILEFPNQAYINKDAFYLTDGESNKKQSMEYLDYYFFQNAYSIFMLNFDFPYFYFDFGSTCVWPKRLELGYGYPMLDRVVYQNDIGDYDNLALFGDIKFNYPGVGYIWGSLFLDEINSIATKFWEKTRAMFAYQFGIKTVVPKLPFASFSFRYTKIEPYCYTHHSINYTPWYNHYISESYTNNGESIGYYLKPNSDEFNVNFICRPYPLSELGIKYQLIRHGTDWGNGAVSGSNLYSELPVIGREDLRKYFLFDGVYEWTNIISFNSSFDLKKYGIPLMLDFTLGYVINSYTGVNNIGEKNSNFFAIEDVENNYINKNGFVFTLTFKAFKY